MYTSHPIQGKNSKGRPEYIMTQINTWGMTGNPDTFRQGATAYRNLKDWAKERRDNAINKANSRAQDLDNTTTSNASTTSFVSSSATHEEETHTTNTRDEMLRSFVQKPLNTTDDQETAESSQDEVKSSYSLSLKRPNISLESDTSRRKRSKAQDSVGVSYGSSNVSTSESPVPRSKRRPRNQD